MNNPARSNILNRLKSPHVATETHPQPFPYQGREQERVHFLVPPLIRGG